VPPRLPRQASGQPAPGPAAPAQSTLSIGTIEVTLLAPPPQPPPAAQPRRADRAAPGRLSHGIGPRFGQGQT